MTYSVYKNIGSLLELNDFFTATEKFNKKFYSVRTVHDEMKVFLDIMALAISRDLVYKISWTMLAESLPGYPTEDEVKLHDAPITGWIPKDENNRTKLYPNIGYVPNETGEHYWISIFEINGFIRVDRIDER